MESTNQETNQSLYSTLDDKDVDMEGANFDGNKIRKDVARSTEATVGTSFNNGQGYQHQELHGYGAPSTSGSYQGHTLNTRTISGAAGGYPVQPHQFSPTQSSISTSIINGNVTYESDPEDNVYGGQTTYRKRNYNGNIGGFRQHGSLRENQSRTECKGYNRSGSEMGYANPRQTTFQAGINSIEKLSGLGVWEILNPQDAINPFIRQYAINGCQVSTEKIQIHNIFKLQSESSRFAAFTNWNNPQLTLLWFKTTPGSVRHLQQKNDGIVAFYDRLSRAINVNTNEAGAHQRQIILLFEVNLGITQDSYKGYQHWSIEPVPVKVNTVLGLGKFVPNFNGNEKVDNVRIPCGITFLNPNPKRHLQYNEYMVFEAKNYKLKYAVEVEVEPAKV